MKKNIAKIRCRNNFITQVLIVIANTLPSNYNIFIFQIYSFHFKWRNYLPVANYNNEEVVLNGTTETVLLNSYKATCRLDLETFNTRAPLIFFLPY